MPSDLTKPELQRLKGRDWEAIREAWLSYVPSFSGLGGLPDQSSDDLLDVQGFSPSSEQPERTGEIEGVRSSVLWEAVCLYQKAKHTNFAAKRLHDEGLETWSLFNYYHSAYLGAKGIMYLLGVTVPLLNSKRWILDVFAAPENDRSGKKIKPESLTDFIAIPLPGLDQHQLWAWFQRVLASTRSAPWDREMAKDIHLIGTSRDMTRQRNGLLYKTSFWIAGDLLQPLAVPTAIPEKYGLDTDAAEFLSSLCAHVQLIFDSLLQDLGKSSLPIRLQVEAAIRSESIPSVN